MQSRTDHQTDSEQQSMIRTQTLWDIKGRIVGYIFSSQDNLKMLQIKITVDQTRKQSMEGLLAALFCSVFNLRKYY